MKIKLTVLLNAPFSFFTKKKGLYSKFGYQHSLLRLIIALIGSDVGVYMFTFSFGFQF